MVRLHMIGVVFCVISFRLIVAAKEHHVNDIVKSLLSNMTLEEKARQLVLDDGQTCCLDNGLFNEVKAKKRFGDLGAGIVMWGRDVDPSLANQIQQAIVNSSRLQIPAIFAEECQHGVQGDHHTIFPSPYTIAASFDEELLEAIGKVIGTEARAGGTTQCWAPVCGLAREPRWGRSEEEMGEDPYLAGQLVAAMVDGMTGHLNLTSPLTTSPLLKHYAAYSSPESGRNAAPMHVGRRELQEIFLPVFAKAVKSGAQGVMSSYNEIDGVPTTGDKWLLTEKLREEFGFTGYVSSDFGAISGLGKGNHGIAENNSDCVRQFLEAGGSVNGHDFGDNYEKLVVQLVNENRLSTETLDVAVGNVLRVKVRLGLMDSKGWTDPTLVQKNLGNNPDHRALAERAALESIVLLQNQAMPSSDSVSPVLPLDATKLKKITVVGPNADEARMGDYSAAGWAGGAPNGGGNIDNFNIVPILEGIKLALPKTEVNYVVGTGTNSDTKNIFWTVVQRHSLTISSTFHPTAPSVPWSSTPAVIEMGEQGIKGTYFPNTNLDGTPTFIRLDYAPNFHFFALGPEPNLLPQGTFSVRWEGIITPDTSVNGGLWNILFCRGCPRKDTKGGARLYVDDKLVIDAWKDMSKSTSDPFDFVKRHPYNIRLEYWQGNARVNGPTLALRWSLLPSGENSTTSISSAAKDASEADAAIVVVGGANNDGSGTTEGEGVDRSSLTLPGDQLQLVQKVWELASIKGVPVIVVLVDGKPTAEPFLKSTMPAVIAAFQAGQAQGTAVASVIFGKYNPSGRLPISFPFSSATLPAYYNHKPSAKRGGWCDAKDGILWSFGHGLSYSNISYSHLVIKNPIVKPSGTVVISTDITNHGPMPAVEVAQLYVRDVISSVTTPAKQLKGFTRVNVGVGETITATFTIDIATELQVLGRDYKWKVENGQFDIMVGPASDNIKLKGSFHVLS